jgi:hypothetical protein
MFINSMSLLCQTNISAFSICITIVVCQRNYMISIALTVRKQPQRQLRSVRRFTSLRGQGNPLTFYTELHDTSCGVYFLRAIIERCANSPTFLTGNETQMTQINPKHSSQRKPRGVGKSIDEKIAETQRQLKELEQRKDEENKKAAKAAAEKRKKELATQRAQEKVAEERALLDLSKWLKANGLHTVSLTLWDANLTQICALLGTLKK